MKKIGVTGLEPATARPPDVYSNHTELHPEIKNKLLRLDSNQRHPD